jgi:non-canonical (house-cleaning) NTP pyrophosphatase
VFPNEASKKFINSNVINEFIITNTNPEVADNLKGIKPYVVLDVQKYLCSELSVNNPSVIVTSEKKCTDIYVASKNTTKLAAVFELTLKESSIFPNDQIYEIYSVEGIFNEIPEQPLGLHETTLGATNRLINCMKAIYNKNGIYISIENGLIEFLLDNGNVSYIDVPIIQYKLPNQEITTINSIKNGVQIPDEYLPMIHQSLKSPNRSITFGSIIEKRLAIKDWHEFISGKSRKYLIKKAMESDPKSGSYFENE